MNKNEQAKIFEISVELDSMYNILEELKINCIPDNSFHTEQYEKIINNIKDLELHLDNIGNVIDYFSGIRDIEPNENILKFFPKKC